MATYYHGNSEIQGGGGGGGNGGGDGLQTLILMNPGYVGYSDAQQPQHTGNNFVFHHHQGTNSLSFSHAPPQSTQTQQFVGIPLTATSSASPSVHTHVHPQHDISSFHGFMPRVPYNMYNQTIDFNTAREVPRSQQGLSLSLSPQQPAYSSFRPPEREVLQSQPHVDDLRGSGGSSSSVSGVSNSVNGMQSVLVSSKYLKAARDLLEEVVNVGKVVKTGGAESSKATKNIVESSSVAADGGDGQTGREPSGKHGGSGAELTTAERQEIQMKKAKLINMLDEVEQRYRQYHHQMQIVITWFEQSAGIGSAKTYTALALQTISKQFRCLKDAILGQIKAASKSLGEEENLGVKIEGGSKLKFVDSQIRQQRALQQLGMIQHNAWRPQRGLPERSVSVLRAWLFEHFLHPYPKDSDKIMLAKQTGLTRSQVSNWFINARVRLWKPMVEEMYVEEVKEQEKNGSGEKTSQNEQNEDSSSKISPSIEKSPGVESQSKRSFMPNINNASPTPMSTSPMIINFQNQSSFNLIGSSDMESMSHGSPKKPRSTEMMNSPTSMDSKANNEHMLMKFENEKQSRDGDGFTLMGAPTNFIGGFGSYSTMGELGRFGADSFPGPYSGNGVSLTLGLPHCDNLSMSANHQTFLPNQSMQLGRGVEMEENEFGPTSTHSTNVYETINIQNRKRYAAQLLPDFVT